MKGVIRALVTCALILVLVPKVSAENIEVKIPIAEDYLRGYDRDLFEHWIDSDGNGCDTRQEVLISEAKKPPKVGKNCKLSKGKWESSYDKKKFKGTGSGLDIDHVVPLAEAWRSGAWKWTSEERQYFANDLKDDRVLIAVSASSNRSKGDKDPADWLPKTDSKSLCQYVLDWVYVKIRYSLTADRREFETINEVINGSSYCQERSKEMVVAFLQNWTKYLPEAPDSEEVEQASSQENKTNSPSPTPSASTSQSSSPTPVPSPTKSTQPPVKYKNCTEARAAGVTPILKSKDPELYALNSALDRDKDGDACED